MILARVVEYHDRTEVSIHDQEIRRILSEKLSFDLSSASFSSSYASGRWDGRIRLFRQGVVPAGLTKKVLEILRVRLPDENIEYINNVKTYTYSSTSLGIDLRKEYQVDAVESALRYKRGIIYAPPRAGKTAIGGAIISRRFSKSSLFIVERRILQDQTVDALSSHLPGVKIGRIGGKYEDEDLSAPVLVCTIQTLLLAYKSELKEFGLKLSVIEDEVEEDLGEFRFESIRRLNESAKLVIVDEVHHATSPSYKFVLDKQRDREYLIGLSGTPWLSIENAKRWRKDLDQGQNLELEGCIGPIIFEVGYDKLIELGYLVPPICYFIVIDKVECSNNDYHTVYSEYVTSKISKRNKYVTHISKTYLSRKKQVLIIVSQIKHGENLLKLIPGSVFMRGSTSDKDRRQIISDFRSRKISCIISTVMGEGVDIPELDVIINAAGGKSSQQCLQRQRAMTPNRDGKQECVYIDFYDKTYPLNRHSKFRFDLLSSIPGFTVRKIDAPDIS